MTSDDTPSDETTDGGKSSGGGSAEPRNPEEMTSILEALAGGQVTTDEAARRIEALAGEPAQSAASDTSAGSTDAADNDDVVPGHTGQMSGPAGADASASFADRDARTDSTTDRDVWSFSTDRPQSDRPQYATHTESVSDDRRGSTSAGSAADSTAAADANIRPAAGVERVSVRAVGRRVRIVGDAGVATISADGPHVLRRNGSVIDVSSDGELASVDGFQLLRGAPRSLDEFRSLGLGKELLIRVNPSLLIDVEVIAGRLHTEAVPRLGRVRMTAGGGKLLDVAEIADALVQAGQATVTGAISSGRSRIRVESGSLNLDLGDTCDVTVHSDAQLGKVSWGGEQSGIAADEVVLGHGNARLDIEVVMGHASIKSGSVNSGKR